METKQLEETISVVSDKFSLPMSHLWEVSVQGVQISGIIDFVLLIMEVLVVLAYSRFAYKKYKEGEYNEDDVIVFYVIGLILLIIFLIFFMIEISSSILRIVSPEYYLIKSFI